MAEREPRAGSDLRLEARRKLNREARRHEGTLTRAERDGFGDTRREVQPRGAIGHVGGESRPVTEEKEPHRDRSVYACIVGRHGQTTIH